MFKKPLEKNNYLRCFFQNTPESLRNILILNKLLNKQN